MDTPTQALLGAAIGQAGFGRSLGRQAVVFGAIGGLLPDLDILMAIAPFGDMLHHRGFTHALWFDLLAGVVCGEVLWRWRGARRREERRSWIGLMVAALLTHPLLDLFTTYGTQILAPFSRRRFALDAVPIIDPAYSLPLLLAVIIGLWIGPRRLGAAAGAWLALALTTSYLFYGLHLNRRAEIHARDQLAREGLRDATVHAYPTLLQAYLRRIVVRHDTEVRVGWMSLWNPRPIRWERISDDRHPLAALLRARPEGRLFEWFAMGQTAARVHETHDGLFIVEIDDLRYGLPSRPREGLWGLRAHFDAHGRLVGAVERFSRPMPRPAGEVFRQLLKLTFD
ncbi:MAG: metal-dependent hydrolase [Vicinamibacteria bacterium]|nr:metal-dependent hydrolase [Vicinamibacteria bacterium]